MKSALPTAIALGVVVFSAGGSQAYRPGFGAAIRADAPAVIKVHGSHRDCRLGKVMGGGPKVLWHAHPGPGNLAWGFMHTPCSPPPPTKKTPRVRAGDQDEKPIVAPRCSAKPSAGPNCPSYSAQWTCASWYNPLKCCTKWQCTSKIR